MDVKILLEIPPWDWPENTASTLLRLLKDPQGDLSDRLIAADLAGSLVVMNDQLAGALLAIVRTSEEPENLRAREAIALGPVLEQSSTDEFEDPDEQPISEPVFRQIQDTFQWLYADMRVPKAVRRCILEASVRAPEAWHMAAIQTAYSSGDTQWELTAVFAMSYIKGFDTQILESLHSRDPLIHLEAVHAASEWALEPAWPHIVDLLSRPRTPRDLLLAAIEAAGSINPIQAGPMLVEYSDSDDPDIAEAATDALMMADSEEFIEDDDEEIGGGWIN